MTTRSVFAIALLPAVAALALAGCASPAPSPTVTVTTTTTASPDQPTTSPTTEPTSEPSAEGACDVNELSISLGESGVGAGQTTLPLIFTNTGSVDCEIGGFPGVSLVGEAGVELAAPATRNDDTPATVSLAPGATGTATLIVSDPGDTEGCTVAPAQGLRIYPPNSYDAIYLETSDLQGCTEPTVNVMSIGPVVAD